MRMPRPPADELYFNFFKAQRTTEYLDKYIHQHHYNGRSIYDRIKFASKVSKINKVGGLWEVQENRGSTTIQTPKVIIATGMASTPSMPVLPGTSDLAVPIIHQEGFGQSSVLSSKDLHEVTVLGGGKSAADMVYACVKACKSVTWIIRKTDSTGPGFLLSPKGKGPYKDAFAIGSTRIAATLTPSILLPDTWWTRFLHRTDRGRSLVKAVWAGADKATREEAGFHERQKVLDGFEHLSPHTP